MSKSMFTRSWTLVVAVVLLAVAVFEPVGGQPALAQTTADLGTIAYVKLSTHDIHAISPDGTGDRVLWTAPQPLSLWSAHDLAWRPDGRELAFSSAHEETCSYYQSDVYAIGYSGTGYRRVTNSPACAVLASLPKGSVTVDVSNYMGLQAKAYVQGAPGIQSVPDGYSTVTFNDVADLGPGVLQPPVGLYGIYRFMPSGPLPDVQPNTTVFGGNLIIFSVYSGVGAFGAGKVSWKADGSALGYGMRTSSGIRQIPANPPYGFAGEDLPVVEYAEPGLVAWGPTPATKDQYLYYSNPALLSDNIEGIYLNTVGDTSGGTKLVSLYDNIVGPNIYDIEWLPDASGFLFIQHYVNFEIFSDIFEYNFATQEITQLTPSLLDESGDGGARGLSISPDGQHIVFERALYPLDTSNSLWIMNRDGTGLHELADDAGRPAWGQTPSLPAPTITSLNPSSAIPGGSAFTLTVNGTGFVSGSVVRWNGSDRATTFVNNTRLTASIMAADIATARSASVTVFNPAPGGRTSNAATFSINNPAPTITSLTPSGAIVGGSAFILTVNGTGFVSGSVVRWNGSDRATTYVNNTRLTASIPAADIAAAGSASVTVFNPAPGGGTSNTATFPISNPNPVPANVSLNSLSAIAGGSAFTLTVNGTGFVSGSVVRWNGSDRVTTYVNDTRLTASIMAADIATARSASVTVFNPAPGGGTSNTATFSINNPVSTITSLNPSNAAVGSSAFILTVNGTGFVSGSVVRWNGSDRATTYVNNTRLTASIPAADIATAGSASVTVFNPAPGGGTSNTAAFGAVNHHYIYLPAILR